MAEDPRLGPVLVVEPEYNRKEHKGQCSVGRRDWMVEQGIRVRKILQLVCWSALLELVGPVILRILLELVGRFQLRLSDA